MKKAEDLTGCRFGRLVVERRDQTHKKAAYWICRCDCGNRTTVQACHLRSGATKSCGCLHYENGKRTTWKIHGASGSRLYKKWQSMKQRCLNPNNSRYSDWGGRGITVCDEWLKFEPFQDWALANGYRDDLTIDRIDNNGPYAPSNCRWATRAEQGNNRRNNVMLTHNGKTQTVAQWAEETGMSEMALRSRIKKLKWTADRALTEPICAQESPNKTPLLGRVGDLAVKKPENGQQGKEKP